ncbi:MAG: AIR synthase related protein [bacterium]|nr:AIR synthase related protein [bacterium]
MKEEDFIKIIQKQTESTFLGDDCAYLKDLGIVITQDNFIEDVHFKKEWATPYQIGYKSAVVNISDILASGGKPKYLTIGLSLPDYTDNKFIDELYCGIKAGSYGAKIIGGDITGGSKIFISITAIGTTVDRKISSRKNAKLGYAVITYGNFGISSKGLEELYQGKKDTIAINTHLEPKLNPEFSERIATKIKTDYAMMDTSDGLADALFKIAQASKCTIKSIYIDGMFGAEDYNLVAAVPKDFLPEINNYKIIGEVVDFNGAVLEIDGQKYSNYDELNLYDHFGG